MKHLGIGFHGFARLLLLIVGRGMLIMIRDGHRPEPKLKSRGGSLVSSDLKPGGM